MRRHPKAVLALVCGLFAGLAAPTARAQRPPAPEPLSIEVADRAVTVSGAAPSGRVLLVGVAQATRSSVSRARPGTCSVIG